MNRLTINDVIGHCNRHTERTEKHMSREMLENMPIEENTFMKEYWEHRQVAEWLKELQAYKDKEEQGLLIELPCKVGDKAWYVHKGGIDEVEVDSFIININLFVNVSLYVGCERFGKTLTPYKTLFFTRSEAESALAKIGGK